jgi:hypothetical protein
MRSVASAPLRRFFFSNPRWSPIMNRFHAVLGLVLLSSTYACSAGSEGTDRSGVPGTGDDWATPAMNLPGPKGDVIPPPRDNEDSDAGGPEAVDGDATRASLGLAGNRIDRR